MDVVNILNTIRDNASQEYKDRVPQATKLTIANVGNPIVQYDVIKNEFLNALVNRIIMTMVSTKRFTNPLAKFKGQEFPFGYSVQNTYTNPVKAEQFNNSIGETLLKKSLPETVTEYYSLNRQDEYPVSISEEQLQTAFVSADEFESFVNSIFNALYSGDAIDEFTLMKQLFVDGVNKGVIKTMGVSKAMASLSASVEDSRDYTKLTRYLGLAFKFPSSLYNNYSEYTKSDTKVVTWTNPEDLLMITTPEVSANIDVDLLAVAFNRDKTSFLGQIETVDHFNGSNILAVICDKRCIKVNDNLFKLKDFENGKGLYKSYFLHHWQTLALSLFANCIALVADDDDEPVDPENPEDELINSLINNQTGEDTQTGEENE